MIMMKKIKNVLSVVLLVSVLVAVGVAATVCASYAVWYVSVPVIVAVWAGLGLLGVNVYERGK